MQGWKPKSMKSTQENKEHISFLNPRAASYRFDEVNAAAIRHFAKEGFVVIKKALNPQEVCHAKALCWDFLSRKLHWDRRKPSTWTANKKDLTPKGMIWSNGAGQAPLPWYIRTRPRVVQIFADIWSAQGQFLQRGMKFGIKDMITSFDGFNVFRPWYLDSGSELWKTQSGWWHIDQNVARSPGIETIQGLVTLYDLDKSTGSTTFVPGSHLWVQQLRPNLKQNAKDFVMLKEISQWGSQQGIRKILLCGEAGDLVLWDSRTIHCNNPALIDKREMKRVHASKLKTYLSSSILNNMSSARSQMQSESKEQSPSELQNGKKESKMEDPDTVNVPPLLRNVVYICMSPKVKVADKSVIRQRIKAYESNSTCSHTPQKVTISWTSQEMKPQKVNEIGDNLKRTLIGCDMLTDPKWNHIPDSGDGDLKFGWYGAQRKEAGDKRDSKGNVINRERRPGNRTSRGGKGRKRVKGGRRGNKGR